MTISPQTHHLIAYGSDRVREGALQALAEGRKNDVDRPGAPLVCVARELSQPIRLHSLAHPFTLPPSALDMRHGDAQLAFLENHLMKLCGSRWNPGQRLVAAYFAEIRAAVAAMRGELDARAEGLSGLVEESHWAFSALMPFPRAHVRPAGGDTFRQEDFIPAEVVFWTGQKFVAAWIDTGRSVLPATRRAQASLAEAGMRIVHLRLPGQRSQPTLLQQLGREFQCFLDGQPLPQTPFRSPSVAASYSSNGR